MASILIVDDEPQVVGLLTTMLTRAGHEVQTANTPQAATEMVNAPACFDLVLSEVGMPVMDGHELTRWIATRCPNSRTILISASAMACGDCPYAPHCALILKPFDPKAVLAAVTSALAAPPPLQCRIAEQLSANYAIALHGFWDLPGTMQSQRESSSPGNESSRPRTDPAFVALLAARTAYRDHMSEHGCHEPSKAVTAYEQIKNRLRAELLSTREVFDSASEKLDRLKRLSSELEFGSEGLSLLERARRLHASAHQVYSLAGKRFNDFLRDEVPAKDRHKPS